MVGIGATTCCNTPRSCEPSRGVPITASVSPSPPMRNRVRCRRALTILYIPHGQVCIPIASSRERACRSSLKGSQSLRLSVILGRGLGSPDHNCGTYVSPSCLPGKPTPTSESSNLHLQRTDPGQKRIGVRVGSSMARTGTMIRCVDPIRILADRVMPTDGPRQDGAGLSFPP